jgi:glucose/arabinose dehydrogenase
MPRARRCITPALVLLFLAGCEEVPVPAAPPATTTAPVTVPASAAEIVGELQVQNLSTGLRHPWAMSFLPDGDMLVTERVGAVQRLAADGGRKAELSGVPAVVAEGQGGLLDIALSPTFAEDRLVYLSYAEPGEDKTAGTAVFRARLDGDALVDGTVIFRQKPKVATRHHFGSRLVFDAAGHLFITMGDRGMRPTAQDLSSHMGTVARIWPDGRVPDDNPFVGVADAQPETWSYGHRNQQGAALHPTTGLLWTHEHGPRGGDEINIPQAGKNYGWPLITHGIDYSGEPISEATGREREGLESPHHVWEVSPGISGMAFYTHARYPQWQQSLFIGAMAQRLLIQLRLDGDQVVAETRHLESLGARIRDVRVGPDGALYALTDDIDGKLLRLTPAGG